MPNFERMLGQCRRWLEQAKGRSQSGDHRQAVKALYHARYVQWPDWVIGYGYDKTMYSQCKNEYDKRVAHTKEEVDGAG